ncbi:MAG: hypothetical protein S4CHLAM45_14280 [Chlamydiales bacterium]|nr:hypothetical protein [Chlamydiales bacterium]MCH9620063.1 hypothetical protein [Chlamydiales bacterium]MCH9623518.1 hypothetical protein [Chlamydiales bacterium]
MLKKIFPVLISCSLFAAPSMTPGVDFSLSNSMPDYVEVNNRVLLKIGGKPVTVMDVVRKMDLVFYQQFPDLVSSPGARYEFYTASWRGMLANVIDDKLICTDAEEKKVEVSDGEIRGEMEKYFGPNVVFTIDRLGIGFDEAWELVKTELTVQQMSGMMVYSKALADVHPREVKRRYEKMLADNPPENRWIYQVVSLRGEDDVETLDVAHKAHNLLAMGQVPLELIKGNVEEKNVKVTLSAEYTRTPKEISGSHRAALETLDVGSFSKPISKRGVAYIFHLKEFQKGEPIPFNEVAQKLKQEVIQEKIEKYNAEYRLKLRKHYGLTDSYLSELIPEETQPFALR